MSNQPAAQRSNGIGFFGLLTIAFVVLKLTGVIAWSWFWVLSPAIFAFALWLAIVIIVIIIVSLIGIRR